MRILDTDTCIRLLRGDRTVIQRRQSVRDSVVTSWITAGELYFGAARSRAPDENRALVHRFLATLSVIALDSVAAQVFGEAKALLIARGETIPDADLLIGALGVAHGAVVVTGNTKHLGRIPGLATEDWIRG